MAISVSGVSRSQQPAQVHATNQAAAPKPVTKQLVSAPQDSVNISPAGRTASQAAKPQQTADTDHDGDSR
jgi:hypothetical protein